MPTTNVARKGPVRADPGQLVMAEAVPFAQRYTYHTTNPIEHVLRPDFFLPVRSQLRAGDTIRIVETDRGQTVVRRYVDVMVIAGGRHASGVLLHVEHGVVELMTEDAFDYPSTKESRSESTLLVQHRGRGRWAITRNGEPVETGFHSREDAEQAIARMA